MQHFTFLHIHLCLGNFHHKLIEAGKNITLKITNTEIYFAYRRKREEVQNSSFVLQVLNIRAQL